MTNLDLSIRCACGCGNHLRVEVRGTDVRIALQGAAYGTGTGTKARLRNRYLSRARTVRACLGHHSRNAKRETRCLTFPPKQWTGHRDW